MEILVIRTLFIPNEDYLSVNINSIKNTRDYIKKQTGNYHLLLIGWSHKFNANINPLLNLCEDTFMTSSVIHYDINYGKYRIMQDIMQYIYKKSYSYILYVDHDILFDTKINITNLLILFDHSIDNQQLGLLLFNHTTDIRHQVDIYENQKCINDHELCWSTVKSSMACGAFITKKDFFETIKLSEPVAVYGLDDIFLIESYEKKNLKTVVLKNIYINHPHNNDEKYNKWKIEQIKQIICNNTSYIKSIQDAYSFWNGSCAN